MTDLTVLHETLLVATGIAIGIVFTLLFWLHKRLTNPPQPAQPTQGLQNATEMSILFQTMRDIVRDQKSMARDFNRGMDTKIQVVREAVRQVVAGHEQLVRMQKEFRHQLESARAESTGTVQTEPPVEEDFPLLNAIAIPEEADFIDEWQGYEEPEQPEEAPEDPQPEYPRNPELAREAFRALLNMEEPEPAITMAASSETMHAQAAPTNGTKPVNGNGTNGAAALRSRVYKYHDAGMNISDIAQELGVGKGEVRLMLSLRHK